ncbi:MAG: hypothetical protein ACKVTZ_18015 [Bacteroidia bacterium]
MGIEVIADSSILQSLREVLQNKGYAATIAEKGSIEVMVSMENIIDVIHFVSQKDAASCQIILVSCF